jgi:aerobic carbon-monoxide dehydrogenase medium subunit
MQTGDAEMIPRSFEYHDMDSVDQALALLAEYGEDAKLMAGGQSLLPMMKLRIVSPAHILDLWRIPGFRDIRDDGNEIRIGALATHRDLEDSSLLQARCPLLSKSAALIADPQVRNLGTIGGAVAHADPSANYSPALVALGAKFVLRGKGGERTVPAKDFFRDLFATELQPTELLTEIRVPALGAGDGWEYFKLSRRAPDFALVSVATIVRADQAGNCTEIDVVLGSVARVPLRADGVEAALRGKRIDRLDVVAAARATVLGANTLSDVHADATYRREVAPVCVRRALEAAVSRAKGRSHR